MTLELSSILAQSLKKCKSKYYFQLRAPLLTTFNRFLLGFFFRFSNFQGIFFCRGNSDNEWLIVVFNILGRASSIGTLAICYIYSAEIFPTVVRNVGIGSSSVWVISKKNIYFRVLCICEFIPILFWITHPTR